MQTGYLHDDAVVGETVDKGVGEPFLHLFAIIVIRTVVHIKHRLFYLAHLVAQQIHRHHGQGVAVLAVLLDIAFVLVLHAEVLSET